MKIAVVAANGKAANKVIDEAVGRGFAVTAFGRKENNTKAQTYIQKNLFDLTADDLKGFDAVVDAFGAWTEDTLPQHSTSLAHLCDILSGTDVRLLVVGGAEKKQDDGYCITDACIGCGNCAAVCPQNCIRTDEIPHVIEQGHCLHCGNCMEACPVGAIERR